MKDLKRLLKKPISEVSTAPLFSLFILVLLVVGVMVTVAQLKNQQEVRSRAQQVVVPAGSKIPWRGRDWNITGVNVAWYNWGCDFGCNQNGGVSGNKNILGNGTTGANAMPGFKDVKNAGIHMVRWWVFPGDPWQIERDSNNVPTGINPAVYADFNAALDLAEQYDLYYNFVLFSGATAFPSTWATNPVQRTKLAEVLGTLFAHYRDNPRILSWEIFNEPEFQIWNNEIDQASVVALGREIAASVHANSNAYVTVGHAMLDGIPMWIGAGLDYYSPHWYPYMSSGNWCAICQTYDQIKARINVDKPIVLGEVYIGSDATPLNNLNEFYTRGYAGAWGWALFWDRTQDKLKVDLPALTNFVQQHADIGPQTVAASSSPTVGSASPTPTAAPPSNSPTPTPIISVSPTPGTGQASLSLIPATGNVAGEGANASTSIALEIHINTSVSVNAAQVDISYPANLLDISSIVYGPRFELFAQEIKSPGNIKMARATNVRPFTSGDIIFATITFKPKIGVKSGTATITFDSTSQVRSDQAQDILGVRNSGTCTICRPGDMDCDGFVDIADLSRMLTVYDTVDSRCFYNTGSKCDIVALSLLLSNYSPRD